MSRVNVGKTFKLTISEDTFNNVLSKSLETQTHTNRLKNQVEIEKNIETKKMDLCYKFLLKLKSVFDITKYKE